MSERVDSTLPPRYEVGQTFLRHFDLCRRSAYLYRTVDSRAHAMDRGTLFHATVEKCIALMVEQGESTIPMELAKAILEETAAERADLTVPWGEKDGLRAAVAHWAEAWDVDPDRIVAVEAPLSLELGEYTVRGRVDLVLRSLAEQALEVPDWKTSFAPDDQAKYEADFQGWFYSMLVLFGRDAAGDCLGDGVQTVIPSQRFPRNKLRQDGSLVERSMVRTRLEISEFRDHVVQLLGSLEHEWEAQEWPAIDGDHCSICPARSLCPIPQEWRHAGLINTPEEAAEAAAWARRTSAQVAATNRELKLWGKEHGAVRFGRDLVLDHVVSESKAVKKRGGRSDWEGLTEAITQTVEFGEPFTLEEWVQPRTSVNFKERTLTPEELESEVAA